MPGRILTLQRQVRELGRLRAGLTETKMKDGREVTYPTSSKTWILTAASRDRLDAAAEVWGGEVAEWQPQGNGPKAWRLITTIDTIDAILPPGDPLSQHLEMWSRGGCQRRCDGEQEMLSGNPCLCRAQFGEDFHEQKQGTVCDIHTRLNVFLPDLPDIGVWRVETKGFWPANHMAGYIDMIKGQVGPQVLVPVRLRIEPRTRVKAGKTSQYIEIVVELRSRATFAEILAAPSTLAIGGPSDTRVIEGAVERPALAAGPAGSAAGAAPPNGRATATPEVWRSRFAQAKTRDELQDMGSRARADGATDQATIAAYQREMDRLLTPARAAAAEAAAEPAAGEPEPLWLTQISASQTVEDLRGVWDRMKAAGLGDPPAPLRTAWWARKSEITGEPPAPPLPAAAAGPPVESAVVEPDRDAAWSKVLKLAGDRGWNTSTVSQLMRDTVGKDPADADGWDFTLFAEHIEAGRVAVPA